MKRRSLARFLFEGAEGLVVLGLVLCTWPVSRRWLRNWGAARDEVRRAWPGDALVSAAHVTSTRAIYVAASAEDVWPWLVQFGLGRAGFYSYELLERLIGIPVVNLESVEPTLQALAVGDEVRLHPKAPGIPVAEVVPARRICFGQLREGAAPESAADLDRSWSFYLEPVAASSCRLILRSCSGPLHDPTLGQRVAAALDQPIDFVMEQRMLRTLKRLAAIPRHDR